jgi:hypothetical protein
MQHTDDLNPIVTGAIDDGVWVPADYFLSSSFAYAFGSEKWIQTKAFRTHPDSGHNSVGSSDAKLCVIRFDGGDILYRAR